MRKRHRIVTGVLGSSMIIVQAFAANQNVCLQRNRVVSWRPVNDTTLVYTDRQMNQYTVTLRDSCRNITNQNATLVYRNWSSLKCLARNDYFRVAASGRGMSTCRVESVREGPPEAQAAGSR